MTSIAVLSACYGNYDTVHALPEQMGVDETILVSDQPIVVPGWKTVVEPRPQLHPRLAAKFPKTMPHEYTDAEWVIWLDGHLEVKTHTLARELVDEVQRSGGTEPGDNIRRGTWGQFRHTSTHSLSEEVALAKVTGKYVGQPMDEQIQNYMRDGCPDAFGMWMTGLIVRRQTPTTRQIGDAWLGEQVRWTVEDQLSLPYLFWLHGMSIEMTELAFDGWWHGSRFRLHQHADGSG